MSTSITANQTPATVPGTGPRMSMEAKVAAAAGPQNVKAVNNSASTNAKVTAAVRARPAPAAKTR